MTEPLLAAAVDIRRWLAEDAALAPAERLRRDRAIGARLPGRNSLERVLGWWRETRPAGDAGRGRRVVSLVRLVCVLLTGFGLVSGIGVGSVAFSYDGRYPVNLLALLGLLVGVPALLLLLTLVSLLPGRVPGLAGLREALSMLNPGRWAGAWLNRYSGLELYGAFGPFPGRFARWQLVVFSQWLAIGFFIGVLGYGWLLVAVTDLAFGWSSTLELDARAVHRLFSLLAAPWSGWLPAATPDLALVEASRFFRLDTEPVPAAEALRLGSWWPFVGLSVVCYGLLPRLLVLLLAGVRVTAATRAMLCQDPEVLALLDRLKAPSVEFLQESEASGPAPAAARALAPDESLDPGTVIVIYNDALGEAAARSWLEARLGTRGGELREAGSRRGAAALAAACDSLPAQVGRVVLFTKGWEPPLLEFSDQLTELRRALGPERTIVVVPIDTAGASVATADHTVWAEFLGRHGDRKLYVMHPDQAGATGAGAQR